MMKNRWLPEKYQLKTLNILLAAHGIILKCLLALAILAGLFPIVVVCDNGNILNCAGAGILFFGTVAGTSLATVGLAIVALRKPSKLSQIYLLAYSVLLVIFRFLALPSAPNFSILLDAGVMLGVMTLISVIFFGAGRHHIEST